MTAPLPPDPAEVTGADRAFARAALAEFKRDLMPGEWLDLTTTLAFALAAERAAVARPVLALAEELGEMSRNIAADARQAQERGEGTYVSFWLGMAQARKEAADRLRRALAGTDDTQQDGAR